MNREDWPVIERTLFAGWPMARGETIDNDAYIGLLSPYGAEDVKAAIHGLLASSRFMPKVAEIIAALPAKAVDDGLTPSQRKQLRDFGARIAAGGGIFNRSSPEIQAKVMADIERQHGKQFVRRNFPKWQATS